MFIIKEMIQISGKAYGQFYGLKINISETQWGLCKSKCMSLTARSKFTNDIVKECIESQNSESQNSGNIENEN